MIKRMNKATSLLLAAAAVASIVPSTGVMAADYTKIEAEEGTIYTAVAYKDGSFYVDGNIKNGEDDGAYLLAGGKYNDLEDVDTGAEVEIYGEKYLSVDNADLFVDLSNGKVTDEDLQDNAEDDAATALRRKVKADNDGRYTTTVASAIPSSLKAVTGVKFSAPYYEAQYTDSKDNTYTVYTDASGNYVDADYNVGKIKVTAGSTYSIAKADDEDNITVSFANGSVIAQDSNYVYRMVDITVNATEAITAINGVTLGEKTTAFASSNEGKTVTFTAIQKISKAQASGDIDGIKYAKTVTTTVLSDEDGKAVETLGEDSLFNVVNGKLINYVEGNDTVDTQLFELKSTKGYYYVDVTDGDEEDVTKLDVDAEGNLWRLYNGYVYKFDNVDSWDKVYKVDGSMDNLSVYNEKNMVVWNEEDEVYSIIGSKAAVEEDTTEEDTTVKSGWVQNEDKTWSYFNADGTQVKGQWLSLNGTWYYIKEDGIMATGWAKVNGTWYYLQASGAMKTGWLLDNGTWYYLQASGAMKTGWLLDNGTWYYLNASGAMLSNTTVNGYKLGSNGAWIR